MLIKNHTKNVVSWTWWLIPVIPAVREAEIERTWFEPFWAKSLRPSVVACACHDTILIGYHNIKVL
jgi:hypothetical protein